MASKEHYDQWNDEKFRLHNKKYVKNRFINPWEIWYAKLWLNIGFEENGKKDFRRPVLVIRRIGILFFIIPLSTQNKNNTFYYALKSVSFDKPSLAILSQVRVIDKRRFLHRIGQVSDGEMIHIEKLLKELFLPRA